MKQELSDAIDMADLTNNQKAKKILLKIAELKEENQKTGLDLVKLLVGTK